MNAMDLQLSVFQKTGTAAQGIRPAGGTAPVQQPSAGGVGAPSFSDVLSALTRKNESPRTAPSSGRLRAMEASVADHANATASRAYPAAAQAAAPSEDTESAEKPGLDLSTKEARKILRDALNSDSVPSELVKLLSDDNGSFSDELLDLILRDDEEDATAELGLGTGDVSDELTSVLTDARQAQELLSTQSGRDLIAAMSERSIAGLVTASS